MFFRILIVFILFGCGDQLAYIPVPGPQGKPGLNGTIAIPIQICPGFTPTYPNVFPEWLICIDNQFYGGYSSNGGFIALIPPGTYSSNGVNASCTVVIGPNCTLN